MSYADWRLEFAKALDPRFHTVEWMDLQFNMNLFGFWCSDTAAIMAEIKTHPTGSREVHGLVAAGDLDGIVALIPMAEAWGKRKGAVIGSVSSHPAWQKLLQNSGYHVTRVTLEKDL
jgi:hypothetical protein